MKARDLSLIALLIGLTLVFIGTHNIDIAWNMNQLEVWVYDVNLMREAKTAGEIYLNGLSMLLAGVFFLVLAFLVAYL